MNEVLVEFVVMVGSELMDETALPVPLPPIGSEAGIDGALRICVNGDEFLGPRHWDRVDVVARNLRSALDDALGGKTAAAAFPDTRLELEITPADDGQVTLCLEGVSVCVPAKSLDEALDACVQRLLALQPPLFRTEALQALERRMRSAPR
jgi:hypothetical protein